MKKNYVFLLIVIIMIFLLACSLSNILKKDGNTTVKTLSDEDINQVVQAYFSDESSIGQDASEFLTDLGFNSLSFEIIGDVIKIGFEQFDDLLPEQMQFRYLIAFLAAERFQPLCQSIQVTVSVSQEPMIVMQGTCEDVRSWRHGEIDLVTWYNRISKDVVWLDSEVDKSDEPQAAVITDPYSWFLEHPQVVEQVFTTYGITLSDPEYFNFIMYDPDTICSAQTEDGTLYEQFHEESILWVNGISQMNSVIQDYENNLDLTLRDLEWSSLSGLEVVTWTIEYSPDGLRLEKFAYIELVPGSDEWFGFDVYETCVDQLGFHLPEPVGLIQTLLSAMQLEGYIFK